MSTNASQELRQSAAAVRLSITWLGTRKSLSTSQRDQAAEVFGAEGSYLSAGKKLFDTKHSAFKALTAIKSAARSYWVDRTLPWPDDGIRLIRQEWIPDFQSTMEDFALNLTDAVAVLESHYSEIRSEARDRLASLYNPDDYPASLDGLFKISWEYPSVEPPDYLMRLNPALYEQEKARVAARFDEAVRLAEEAFATQFQDVIEHLLERLSGTSEDGRPKIMRDSAVDNVHEFLERFRSLNIHSSASLDALVEQAQSAVRGVTPKALRADGSARATVTAQLASVQEQLNGLIIDRPRRVITRPDQTDAA